MKTGQNRSLVFISAGVAGHVIPRMNRTPRDTTYSFRSVSVAYPFHIRSLSVTNRDLNFAYGESRKGYGYVTVVSRSLRLQLRLCRGCRRTLTVSYGKIKIFKQFENCLPERKSLRKHGGLSRFIPDHYGHVYGKRTELPRTFTV